MIVRFRSFQCVSAVLALPPTIRSRLYEQQCRKGHVTSAIKRLASTNSSGTVRKAGPVKKSPSTAPATYKPVDGYKAASYANYVDGLVSRASGRSEPFLLYKAPSHKNYYIACGVMATCFTAAAVGCLSTINLGYKNKEQLWWQLPLLGFATGWCLLVAFRSAVAPRKLVHELWLLPRTAGTGVSTPRLVEIRCRSWPFLVGSDKKWKAAVEDITLSRTYGSSGYGTADRGGRHSIATTAARDAAEYNQFMEQESKSDGFVVGKMVAGVDRVKHLFQEGKQVLHWHGIHAWMVVKGNGSFRLDGRGLMIQGGKGLDMLFAQHSR